MVKRHKSRLLQIGAIVSRCLVYRFGLLAPTAQADRVREQMRTAHAYRNTLTEIERSRRTAWREVMSGGEGEARALEEQARAADTEIDRLVTALRAERSETRTREVSTDLRGQLVRARQVRKDARAALRATRARLRTDPTIQHALDAVNDRAAERIRAARATCGVYWGTYLLVEAAAKKAGDDTPMYDGAAPNDPRFSRWSGEARLGVQIQNGMAATDLFGEDQRMRIAPVSEGAWHSASRSERRKLSRTTLSIRIGSDDARKPIWATWPMLMHRAIPSGARVKNAVVSLRRHGPREEWYVTITVDVSDVQPSQGREAKGRVALDLGWRVIGDDLRVVTWADDEGATGDLRLSSRDLSRMAKPAELRAVRDQRFNDARTALTTALDGITELPTWLTETITHLSQWRSPARLAALAIRWRDARFAGDEAAYGALEAWRYRDHHLWAWEANQRTGSLRHRREIYRVFAAQIANKYKTIVLEDFDLRKVAEKSAPETAKAENQTARGNRQTAAVSELRLAIINAAKARGRECVVVDARDTTHICNTCGSVERFEAAEQIEHTCACGARWDQDVNAAANLLTRACERGGGSRSSGIARDTGIDGVPETKWQKVARLRTEKRNRKTTAREAEGNGAE
jgi:transposase